MRVSLVLAVAGGAMFLESGRFFGTRMSLSITYAIGVTVVGLDSVVLLAFQRDCLNESRKRGSCIGAVVARWNLMVRFEVV